MSMMQRFQLDDRAALVTGSSRGIGRAIALGLAECGAAVAVHGTKPAKALDETLAAMCAYRDVGFDGVMIPDHTPVLTGPGPWHAGMAFAVGYMRALARAAGVSL